MGFLTAPLVALMAMAELVEERAVVGLVEEERAVVEQDLVAVGRVGRGPVEMEAGWVMVGVLQGRPWVPMEAGWVVEVWALVPTVEGAAGMEAVVVVASVVEEKAVVGVASAGEAESPVVEVGTEACF